MTWGENRPHPGAEDGFTLIEVLIALVLLVAGLLALFGALDTTVQASWTTRGREGAVTLAREISEEAHAIPFSQLNASTIVSTLQTMPGLASSSQSSWQIVRRGVTYTATANVCSIDDPKDGYGAHDSSFCSDSSQTGTTDQQPIDMKRITVTVSWTNRVGNHSVTEVSTVTSAGQVVGFSTSNLVLAFPSIGSSGVSGTTSQPIITSNSVAPLTFSVTAPSGTTAIIWTVNGSPQSWTSTTSGTTWTSSGWNLSGLSDGTYQVGAQAQDGSGVIGPAVTIPVTLSRNIPAAPALTAYGFNQNLFSSGTAITAAEIQWTPNAELNVSGYRIYNPSGALICTTSNSTQNAACGASAWCMTATSCIDLNPPPPTSSNLTYQVAALYHDSNGVLQEAPRTSVNLAGSQVDSYALAPSTGNSGTNCSGTPTHDLLSTYAPGSDTLQSPGSVTFCTGGFSQGKSVGSGGSASAYFTNTGAQACSVTATLSVDGNSSGSVNATATAAAGTSTPAKLNFNFPSGSYLTMGVGDKLNLNFAFTGTACLLTTMHYGGSSYPGSFQTSPQSISAPASPTSLTVTPQQDGTAVLSWTPPTTGAPVSLYRIYRDGHDYSNRYDTVDPATCISSCTYTDKNRSGAHSYYVTAVGGQTPGSNEAESLPAGPVSG